MHRDFFEKEIGVILYQNEIVLKLDNKKFYLAHGDGLVKNDFGYLILKKIFRNKMVQNLYSLIHPNLGIKLAKGTSETSRNHTGNKNYGEGDGLFEFAKSKFKAGFDYVILGHTHQKQFEEIDNKVYANLGTWLNKPMYGIYENKKFEIKDLK